MPKAKQTNGLALGTWRPISNQFTDVLEYGKWKGIGRMSTK